MKEFRRIYTEIESQIVEMERFKRYTITIEFKVAKANELKRFEMDRTDTLDWMDEKKQFLEDQNYYSKTFCKIDFNNLIINIVCIYI